MLLQIPFQKIPEKKLKEITFSEYYLQKVYEVRRKLVLSVLLYIISLFVAFSAQYSFIWIYKNVNWMNSDSTQIDAPNELQSENTVSDLLVFSSCFGGSGNDTGLSITVDSLGNIYVVGSTSSFDFPLINPEDSSINGESDCFVFKLDSSGQLEYSTFLGGSGSDEANDIAVDSNGNAYVTGYTTSQDFPIINAFDESYNGGKDCFVTKISPDGNRLLFSSYLGGSGDDVGSSLAIDYTESVYITGWSTNHSSSNDFPIINSDPMLLGGGLADCFIVKLNPTGDTLYYSTLVGGSGYDCSLSIAVDSEANAIITGETHSQDFPTSEALDNHLDGVSDAFLLKLNASGNGIYYSTFLGGARGERGNSLIIDPQGDTYIIGTTSSHDYPVANAYDDSFNGENDCFITKINPSGDVLLYSSYVGGSDTDRASALAIDAFGNAFVTGFTESSDFPVVKAYDSTYNDRFGADCFVYKDNCRGEGLSYSTFIGGSSEEYSTSIAIDSTGEVYVVGTTSSTDFPIIDSTYNSTSPHTNCFVFKLIDAEDYDGDGLLNDDEDLLGTNPSDTDSDKDGMSDYWEVTYGLDALIDDSNDDLDSDRLSNLEEYQNGTDPRDPDSDDDLLSDGDELIDQGTDPRNPDSDSDMLLDGDEINLYFTNPLSNDTDEDGMLDNWEIIHSLNPNVNDTSEDPDNDYLTNLEEFENSCDPNDMDTDGDSLFDGEEVKTYFCSPTMLDTDMDWLGDGVEVIFWHTSPILNDTDSDGMLDGWETFYGLNATEADGDEDTDFDGLINLWEFYNSTDPRDIDSDNDGLLDGLEVHVYNTNPTRNDSDNDGLSDKNELFAYETNATNSDTDYDGMVDSWEIRYGLNPRSNDSDSDLDNDGLTNLEEYVIGTAPDDYDSDNDGLPDMWEVTYDLNAVMYSAYLDSDDDTLTDIMEYRIGTHPGVLDSDGDGISDEWEWNNGFNPTDSTIPFFEMVLYHSEMIIILTILSGLMLFLFFWKFLKSQSKKGGNYNKY